MRPVNRREFLQAVEAMGIACVLPAAMGACASLPYARGIAETDRLVVLRSEIPPSGTVLVETPDDQLPILLRRVSDNDFIALSTKCTHRGCQVENAGTQLVCPCHGSAFTLTGERVQGPAERALTRFAVTSDETRTYISRKAVSS